MLQLGWFSTGRGEGSRGLLQRAQAEIQRGALEATIQFVFCNREVGEAEGSDRFLELVESYGIPLVTYSSRHFRRDYGVRVFENRVAFDREVMRRLEGFRPDLCVLAGYMLITSPELCTYYRMINLHPALPHGPIGTWQEVIWQLIAQGATETGAMVFHVTEEVDQGAPITYCSFPIRGGAFDAAWGEIAGKEVVDLQSHPGEELQLFQGIRREGMKREQPLLTQTLVAFAQGRLRFQGEVVVDASGRRAEPLDLTEAVEAAVAAE